MHATWHEVAVALASRRLHRAAGAVACVAAVLLGHGVLWLAVSLDAASGGVRSAAVQIRHYTMPAPATARESSRPGLAPDAVRVAVLPQRSTRTPAPPSPAVMTAQADSTAVPGESEASPLDAQAAPSKTSVMTPGSAPGATMKSYSSCRPLP